MAPRLELQEVLKDILGSDHVYFQPPPGIQMEYPCIVYQRDFIELDHANNSTYQKYKRYQVTVIDRNPDSEIHEKILELPMCSYERFFTSDNLNHDVLRLFF